MSLEAAINELNANMTRNNALLEQLLARGDAPAPVKPAAPKASATVAPTVAPVAAAPAAPSQAPAPAASPAPSLDYAKDVQPALLGLSAAKGRDALVGLLGEFGVKKGTELQPGQWQAAIDRANALKAG